ncbi:BREX-2 system phosphatase PglZ [Occultella gossypii]|uniref:BREX-2 system phosphatase PglZ n=1 Tax=Occultella gossypii TaxID=2800820 RepID=A0ABS7S5P6_9MICO|nr:BREX-2 system phosphatase PglZ [Occultella gossypii]MBZ2195402.1 BREX-2 system phosphatase PglZ [Occultella gossypii]
MSAPATSTVPLASAGLVTERARSLVSRGSARMLLLRSEPRWDGPPSIAVDGTTVQIRPGRSQLAVLTDYTDLPDDEYLVVLTDRNEQDLGSAVMLRAAGQTIERPDDWSAVASMVGAHTIDPALRKQGQWAAGALLEHRPRSGWPQVTTGVLTADAAFGNLLAELLGELLPARWDASRLTEVLHGASARAVWAATDEDLRKHLTRWAGDALGPQTVFVLAAAASTQVSVVAIGLAMDVLWPAQPPAQIEADRISARTRIERYVGGRPVESLHARALALDARDTLERMLDADDPDHANVLRQAEALLGDLGWPDGALLSSVLPAGRSARSEVLAQAIQGFLAGRGTDAVEEGLRDVLAHRLSRHEGREVEAARMATRLVRWLESEPADTSATLGDSLHLQVDDGGWADRALASIWTGSALAPVAHAYRRLAERVQAIRAKRDFTAAQQLAAVTATDEPTPAVVLLENLLKEVVHPLTKATRVLLIVLDGMSTRVATEIAQGAMEAGWTELIPAASSTRAAGLAVLPTMTTFSRTSLLSGELRAGTQATEKSRFPKVIEGPIFHKDDLRPAGGDLVAQVVGTAIDDRATTVVGVVLNTIDDSLAKDDPDGTRWNLDRVQHLRALLNRATLAGRTVILTADHGHVVERGGEYRATAGADTRWRPVSTGAAATDEIEVRGRRVLAAGGEAVLAVTVGLRYGAKAAGYHGGGSLAEITVPIIVLDRSNRPQIGGWKIAPSQTPSWWNEPAVKHRYESVVEERTDKTRRRRPREEAPGQGSFDLILAQPLPVDGTAALSSVVDQLLDSDVYARQRKRAGRGALGDDVVRTLLTTLADRGGRAHRETLAGLVGSSLPAVESTLAALRRLLNVEGYAVLSDDADGVTVVLDEALLRDQFELGGQR